MMLRGNQWKTHGKQRACVGTTENTRKTFVLHWNHAKTQGKRRFCLGANGKCKENICFVLGPMETKRKHMRYVGSH